LSDAVEKITQEIKRKGAIPLARFMELALYCPECGYYEKEKDKVGRRGDFFTSVSVGSLFGELLAFQFAQWLEADGGKTECPKSNQSKVKIVEAGAHDGQLASDILQWLSERRGDLFERVEYWIVEPSARRRDWQREKLAIFGEVVNWVSEISGLEKNLQSSPAIFFSNELLDAMPLHRLRWDAKEKKWSEWGVALDAGRFVWSRIPHANIHGSRFTFQGIDLGKLSDVLPDGFTIEISPAAENWWEQAAKILKNGRLLAIDYGLTTEEFFTPDRKDGTLRAYRGHQLSRDVLANPGEQDITAHVNFSAIQAVGDEAGLRTDLFISQAKFLTSIAEQAWKHADLFGEWNAARTRQFQTLTHPEHLGRPFRVLVQSRQSGA
jgi:SAM-dependent MidA family methyltransferase